MWSWVIQGFHQQQKGNFSNGIYFKTNRIQGKDETFDAEKTSTEDFQNQTVSKQPQFYGGSRKRGSFWAHY